MSGIRPNIFGKAMALNGDKTSTGATCIAIAHTTTCGGKMSLRVDDITTACPGCGQTGKIVTGESRVINHGKSQAVNGSIVQCGCPFGSNVVIAGTPFAHYKSPVNSPEFSGAESHTGYAKTRKLPPYLTGEKTGSEFIPDYPVLRNSLIFPDQQLRNMLSQNNYDVMLLTIIEAFEVLQSWGWKETKTAWVEVTQSDAGQALINYGVNGKDVVTTSMIIVKLGEFGIRATVYINHKGTELIKLTGYPGIRKILNAPVFGLKNPRIVDLGIGKYGLAKSIVDGARLTFYVAAAYRTLDFILNDNTSLAKFIGSLATDVVKIGIASTISWGLGTVAVAYIPFISAPLVVVVGFGLLAAWGLNELDNKFGITDRVVAYIEAAQQEFAEKAREMEKGLLDLGAMYADKMLDKGREVIVFEIKRYLRDSISNITPRIY